MIDQARMQELYIRDVTRIANRESILPMQEACEHAGEWVGKHWREVEQDVLEMRQSDLITLAECM